MRIIRVISHRDLVQMQVHPRTSPCYAYGAWRADNVNSARVKIRKRTKFRRGGHAFCGCHANSFMELF